MVALRLAVVGHVEWVDFLALERLPGRGEIAHAENAFWRAAGGGGVAATVLREMGVEVDFFCALGRDAHGEAAASQLREQGIHLEVAWRSEPTSRALTLLEPGGERTIVTVGARLEPVGADALAWDRLQDAAGVYFTAGDGRALSHARAASVLVASPRARQPLAEETIELDALVFSAHDPDESQWAEGVKNSARLLVATAGADGGRWWGESSGSWRAAELPGPPRDSYGSGDSFAAGLTLGLAHGDTMAEATALGARWGALAVTRPGAP